MSPTGIRAHPAKIVDDIEAAAAEADSRQTAGSRSSSRSSSSSKDSFVMLMIGVSFDMAVEGFAMFDVTCLPACDAQHICDATTHPVH